MRFVNRILAILVSLAVIVATVCILLVTVAGVRPANLSPTPWFQTQLNQFVSLGTDAWNRTVGIAAGMLLLGLIVFFLNLIPRRTRTVERDRRIRSDQVVTEEPVGPYDEARTVREPIVRRDTDEVIEDRGV